MNLVQLRNVVAVVERGSLRGAARQLGVAQPALTRSVRDLENELDAALFERAHKGMTATAIGEVLYRRAKGIEAEVRRTLDEIEQIRGHVTGTVTVGLSTATHLALLPRVLRPFCRRFPDVLIKLVEGLFPALEPTLRNGQIDLYYGPVTHALIDPSLIVEPLFENQRILIARRGHPLAGACSIRELAQARWITSPVEVGSRCEVQAMFADAGLPAPRIAVEAASGISIISAVLSLDLIAALPAQWCRVIEANPLIIKIPVQETSLAPWISAVRPARMPMTPAAEFFNDLVLRAAPHIAAEACRCSKTQGGCD